MSVKVVDTKTKDGHPNESIRLALEPDPMHQVTFIPLPSGSSQREDELAFQRGVLQLLALMVEEMNATTYLRTMRGDNDA